MARQRKRAKTGPKADTGRRCVVCHEGENPQWRRIMWKGVEADACNRCGISYNELERNCRRVNGRRLTDTEAVAWSRGRRRQSSEVVFPISERDAAAILVCMAGRSQSDSSSSAPSHNPPCPTTSTFTLLRPRAQTYSPSAPSSVKATKSLEVTVEDDYAYLNPGLSCSESVSPTWSAYDLASPTAMSFFPINAEPVSSVKEDVRRKKELSSPAVGK